MEEQLRILVTLGFTLLLIMLRLESEKFGAAEYDEPALDGRPPSLRWRPAPARLYPGALLNSIATAFIDEAAFRGLLFAFLLGTGMDGSAANLIQAVVYALSTRLGGRGRDLYGVGL